MLDRRLAARESHERLAAPSGHVEPLAVLRDLDAVRARCFAARHDLPPRPRVPLPELAVLLAGLHVGPAARRPSRLKVRRREAAFRQRHNGVQANRIGRNGAAHPRQSQWLRTLVELEDLDRLSVAVMDHVQRLDPVLARTKKQAVRPELVFLFRIDRTRT